MFFKTNIMNGRKNLANLVRKFLRGKQNDSGRSDRRSLREDRTMEKQL